MNKKKIRKYSETLYKEKLSLQMKLGQTNQ